MVTIAGVILALVAGSAAASTPQQIHNLKIANLYFAANSPPIPPLNQFEVLIKNNGGGYDHTAFQGVRVGCFGNQCDEIINDPEAYIENNSAKYPTNLGLAVCPLTLFMTTGKAGCIVLIPANERVAITGFHYVNSVEKQLTTPNVRAYLPWILKHSMETGSRFGGQYSVFQHAVLAYIVGASEYTAKWNAAHGYGARYGFNTAAIASIEKSDPKAAGIFGGKNVGCVDTNKETNSVAERMLPQAAQIANSKPSSNPIVQAEQYNAKQSMSMTKALLLGATSLGQEEQRQQEPCRQSTD